MTQDPYVYSFHLCDFINSVVHITTRALNTASMKYEWHKVPEIIKKRPPKTIREFYLDPNRKHSYAKKGSPLRREIAKHPVKVRRLSVLVRMIRENPDDLTLFKQAYNEIVRLLTIGYKKDKFKFQFPEPEFHPDILKKRLSWTP